MPSFTQKKEEPKKTNDNREFLCGLFPREGKYGKFFKGITKDGYEVYLQENHKQGETQPTYYITISKEPVAKK